jgi:uncharacterized membrane protein YhiD involved in acid resistance
LIGMPCETRARRAAFAAVVVLCVGVLGPRSAWARQPNPSGLPGQTAENGKQADTDNHPPHPLHEIDDAMVRLPLAAALGAALALRPRRRGTPKRDPAVVQTQIILAVVGAVIMLVVGASLARAFGIVGVASLIRYRSKIEDPKDAVVMLCALAVGLAAGVGLYSLAVFSTVFIVAALAVIESFEPTAHKTFELAVKLGKDTDERRPKVEAILDRYAMSYELRTTSDEALAYAVKVPIGTDLEPVTDAIRKLDAKEATVEWTETKPKAK